ncbi:carbohydrate binding domain-containing protein [Streptacidiphilus sp. MAP5-52]|uniref:galactose-binding domain-containing protein n=1 Tax=Streptacidiphilus sp. MAP5-52 TaxID=3156267 RepID=UPI0035142E0A
MTPTIQKRIRTLIAAFALVAASVLALAVTPSPAHAASPFVLFDNTSYNNDNLQANYGLTPAAVAYDYWNMSCANTTTYSCTLPPKDAYQDFIKSQAGTIPATSPLTLDFEGLDITSSTPTNQAVNDCQAWQTLISWTRAVIPAGQPLGNYSYDWSQSSAGTSCNTTLHTEAGGLTFFAPSLYTHSTDLTGTDWTNWTNLVTGSITNDNQIAPGQPIYGYIWPQWDSTSGTATDPIMDSTSWSQELTYLRSETQGAIVWSGPQELSSASCGWIGATHNFMTALTGTGGSTGALRANVQFPDTCMLNRGTTNAIPVTITNTGSTTSAATTLTISGGTGISGTASPSAVPALAAGGNWSTTAGITIGADASLGDTVVTFSLAGEGLQNRTAIIQDTDLAVNKPATQSSTAGSASASLADDGNTSSYSQTNSDAQAWWQVDLGSSQSIGGIDLYAGATDAKNYYLIVSDSASPAIQTAPLPPNQWVETSSGTWVMNVYDSTFRDYLWHGDTNPEGMARSTDVPAGITGRYVRVQLYGTGSLSLDEVDVTPGMPDPPNRLGQDPVANGGFETGALAPWATSTGSASIVTSPALSGVYTVQLAAATFLEQTIAVKPNTTYTLAGYLETTSSANGAELGVENYGGVYSTYWTSSTSWTRGTVTFTTGPTNTTAEIFLYNDQGSGNDYADTITVYPTS